MIRFRDETARKYGLDLLVHTNQEGVDARHQPVRPRLVALHPGDEDRGAEAGARRRPLRRRLRRRAPRRGEEPRQGAHLLLPLGEPRLGPEEPAAGALVALQHARQAGRVDPRLPAVELDRARRLAIHPRRERSTIVPLYFAAERPVVDALRPADHGRRRAHAARARRGAGDAARPLPHARLLSADRRDRIGRRDARRDRRRDVRRPHLRAPGPADRPRRGRRRWR